MRILIIVIDFDFVVFLQPQTIAANVKLNKHTIANFKVIASVIWAVTLQYIRSMGLSTTDDDNEFVVNIMIQ